MPPSDLGSAHNPRSVHVAAIPILVELGDDELSLLRLASAYPLLLQCPRNVAAGVDGTIHTKRKSTSLDRIGS
jgi:hypothetical protein